jgi:hypothetical protein
VTTLPLPERPRTPTVPGSLDELDASDLDDASRALISVPLLHERSAQLGLSVGPSVSVGPGLSIGPDLSLSPAGEGILDDDSFAARGSSDVALLEGVTRIAAAVEVLVGGWLALSPWLVGSNGSSALRWSNLIVGLLLVALGVLRLSRPATPRGPATSFGLGAWTIVAAFVLSFQNGATGTAPLWSAIGCGAVLTGAAAWATTETERAGLPRP